jgi:hypothetical protein
VLYGERMSDTIETRYTDKRTAERFIRTGLLDEKAWEKHLKSLPDVADKAVPVESSMSTDGVDDDSED